MAGHFLLGGKKIILGVCGGIASYKVLDWLRQLKTDGADIDVIMTDAATRFITPLTFAALSGKKVHGHMFDDHDQEKIPHISLATATDLVVIAPATAHTIARLAHGLADDLLSTVALATRAKIIVFPAMNCNMYLHPATQANITILRQYGYQVVEPASGTMACGQQGPGRLPEWNTARQAILAMFAPQDLAGRKVLITAGPTREIIDPARYISNRSSGKMGYAIAEAAHSRGAQVTLVSGPVTLTPPQGITVIQVETAEEMRQAVLNKAETVDCVIKAAAVADFRPRDRHQDKIKKTQANLHLDLLPNTDILAELGAQKTGTRPLLVGFAAESAHHLAEGMRKLEQKNLDLVAVNDIGGAESGFEVNTNQVTLLGRDGFREDLPVLSKEETAHRILDRVACLLPGS